MDRHFRCTACGKCCFGWLPLTLADALAHVERFPLSMVWTPVRQGAKAFALTEKLGVSLRTRDRKTIAVRIVPTGYIPPTVPCPALTGEGLCGIHATKPTRCRTMPFFPYRDEADQADLLLPRPGWACDTSDAAPAVYRDKRIIDRTEFDAEKRMLEDQASTIKGYGEHLLATIPGMADALAQALTRTNGHVAVSFASLLRLLPDGQAAAAAQLAVLKSFAEKPDFPAEYRRNYEDWAWEAEGLI